MHTTNVLQSLAAWVLWNSSGAAVLILLILAVRFFVGTAMSARWRSNLWLLVIARLMIPLLPAILISLPAKFTPLSNHIESDTALSIAIIEDGSVAAPHSVIAPSHANTATQSSSLAWTQILIVVWLAGAGFLLAQLLISSIRLARAVRRLQPIGNPGILELHRSCCELMGVANIPPLLARDIHFAPALIGVLRPKILLPRSIESQLTLDEIRLVLLHELAHLRRRDVLQKYVVAILAALHWFNPLLWMANSRIAADREFACDEEVLRITSRQNGRDYGRILLKLVEMMNANRLPAGAVGVVDRTSLVQRRIDMIASYAPRTGRHSALMRSAAAALVLAAGITALRAQTAPAGSPPASAQTNAEYRIYDVSALLAEIPDSVNSGSAPEVDVDESLVKAGKVKMAEGDVPQSLDRAKLAGQLESWLKAAIGNDARLSLSASDGKLTAFTQPATQARIAHMLEQLGARRAIQATIETRAFTFPTFPAVSAELADKIRVSLAPGGAPVEISEYELSQLMHALQQSPNGSVVTAPRVTLFDGQRAQVYVATSKVDVNDTSDREKRSDEISPGVTTGGGYTSLKIRPSVDADHVHIALDFDFESSRAEDLKSAPRAAGVKAQISTAGKVRVNRTLSTATGHTLLMNLAPTALGEGPVRILLVRPIIVSKV